ncbi:Detected protein of confused Function [Hibiscus syriacus]|uniref:Detected protein of confused Function n=1 Tax=Hibiscus syriacus TaxID=106335 RepID=A0A6A2ZWM2_HIBSY|nr:Detected protein of confused Function [Hibiscus syriacus]
MGVKDSGESSSSGDNDGRCQKSQSLNFGGFDEFEEGEGETCCDIDDDDFVALNSYSVQCDRTDDVWKIELEEDEFRHPLVREINRLIQLRLSWNSKLESDMRHLLRSLRPRQVCAVLLSQDDERVVLQFFYWADRQWRYRHNPIVYYAMLEILSKTKWCQGARRVLRLMARRGIQCRPEAFSYLMVSYSRAGNLKNALKVLTLLQKAGVELNLALCNTAIHVLVMANRLEKALKFFERMQIIGIIPNVVTYNCLIKGYCNLNQVENALQLIADMSSKNCSPDKVSYYTIMSFFCKEKQVNEVRDLMEKIVKESNLLPDMVTYNTLIHKLSKHGHADEALDFLREAEARGFQIDKVGHSAIIHS